jgi:hypothetical protein
MNRKMYIALSCAAFFLGMMVIAFQNEWIIIKLPISRTEELDRTSAKIAKKNAVIIYWDETKWLKETKDILWPHDKSEQIKHLICSWLEVAHNERADAQKIKLQTVILACKDLDAYISFDRSPFEKEWSIYKKWHHLESLIKTLKDNAISLRSITWLVNHEPVQDPHLDFQESWPLDGFLNNQRQ